MLTQWILCGAFLLAIVAGWKVPSSKSMTDEERAGRIKRQLNRFCWALGIIMLTAFLGSCCYTIWRDVHEPVPADYPTSSSFVDEAPRYQRGLFFFGIIKSLRSHPFLLPCGTRRAELSSNSPRSAERVDCSVQVI